MDYSIQCLDKEHIYMIHKEVIKDFGGELGFTIETDRKIESILAQQYPYFGYNKYPTVYHKAAVLMYMLTKGHCFIDGNKRVGINAAIVFLTINGYEDHMTDDDGYEKTMEIAGVQVAESQRDSYINELAHWLSKRFY